MRITYLQPTIEYLQAGRLTPRQLDAFHAALIADTRRPAFERRHLLRAIEHATWCLDSALAAARHTSQASRAHFYLQFVAADLDETRRRDNLFRDTVTAHGGTLSPNEERLMLRYRDLSGDGAWMSCGPPPADGQACIVVDRFHDGPSTVPTDDRRHFDFDAGGAKARAWFLRLLERGRR